MMKLGFAVLLIMALVIINSSLIPAAMVDSVLTIDCNSRCSERCSKAGVKDRCLKYCGICCRECNCVPSGTYGNKDECPCYRDKKSSKGKPKCP